MPLYNSGLGNFFSHLAREFVCFFFWGVFFQQPLVVVVFFKKETPANLFHVFVIEQKHGGVRSGWVGRGMVFN